MTEPQRVGVRQLEATRRFVEQAGAPAHAAWGTPAAKDVVEKLVPGLIAKLKVARDDDFDGLGGVRPFIEQLGVASGKKGVRSLSDLPMALFGLSARWSVARYVGIDLREEAYKLIEHWVLQLPLETKPKALLLSTLYAIAVRLPDRR